MSADDDLDFIEDGADDARDDDAGPPYPVLVVDDDEDVHAVTRLALSDFRLAGRRLDLISARSAADAADRLAAGLRPAVILLDVVMETSDAGLNLAARIREEFGLRVTRIVLRTGQPGEAPEREALLRFDINDYRSKTELTDDRLFAVMLSALRSYEHLAALEDSKRELEARVAKRTRDLEAALASNDALLKALQDYRQRLDEELDAARETQRMALPTDERLADIAARFGVTVAWRFETCSELGGDFWDVRPIDETRLAVMAVDFSGHGVGAALNALRMHGLAVSLISGGLTPDAYLAKLNDAMQPLLPMGQYATMFFGIIDCARDRLYYAPAACPTPFLIPVGGADPEALPGRGFTVGMIEGARYEMLERPFPPGATLFLYSDALYESPMGPDRTHWGMEGLTRAAAAAAQPGAAGFLDRLIADFDARARRPLDDDLTAIALTREPANGSFAI